MLTVIALLLIVLVLAAIDSNGFLPLCGLIIGGAVLFGYFN